MPGQKKDQDKSRETEAGGLSGRAGHLLGNPTARDRSTVSVDGYEAIMTQHYAAMERAVKKAVAYRAKLRHRVLVLPQIQYATYKEN